MTPLISGILKCSKRRKTKLWWNKHYPRLVPPLSWLRLTTHNSRDPAINDQHPCCWPDMPVYTCKIVKYRFHSLTKKTWLTWGPAHDFFCYSEFGDTWTSEKQASTKSQPRGLGWKKPLSNASPQMKFFTNFQGPYRQFWNGNTTFFGEFFVGKIWWVWGPAHDIFCCSDFGDTWTSKKQASTKS